jgi:serine/threonine protein kinase
MSLQLRVIVGPQAGTCFPLSPSQPILIGRAADCTIRLDDLTVSRVQCRIELAEGQAVLHDHGSRWGTAVNGQWIDRRELQPGDVITLGETDLRFEDATAVIASTLVPFRHDAARQESPPPRKPASSPSPAELAKLVGRRILRFDIHSVIAPARTGIVFRACDAENGGDVAFKVFYPRMFQTDAAMERFVRAAKTMLSIRHESLVALYLAGRHEGLCFTASEYVDGESAAQLIERVGISGMLSWERALRIAVQIAQALAVAEEHHIVHRNVTPRNILIRCSDGVAKLGDLIFAKALEGVQAVQVTQPGELIGELAYMSPEQTGAADVIDCRSDLYGLGATLYALLTGRPPLEGRDPAETIHKIQTQEPEPPRKYHLSISPLFEGVVLRMLAKRPADRYQTAGQLLTDLRRVAQYQGYSLPM